MDIPFYTPYRDFNFYDIIPPILVTFNMPIYPPSIAYYPLNQIDRSADMDSEVSAYPRRGSRYLTNAQTMQLAPVAIRSNSSLRADHAGADAPLPNGNSKSQSPDAIDGPCPLHLEISR